jgi:hypothetical protein
MAIRSGKARTFVIATTRATRMMSLRLLYDHSVNGVCRRMEAATNTRFSATPGNLRV